MVEQYGDWEHCSADPRTQDCGELRGVYSNSLFRQLLPSRVPAPVLSLCWACRSISTRSLGKAGALHTYVPVIRAAAYSPLFVANSLN